MWKESTGWEAGSGISGAKKEEITLNVLSTGRAGLKAELRILNPNAPVTNSSKA